MTTPDLSHLANGVQPDRVEHLTRRAFIERVDYETGPLAEFAGVGYSLGVYIANDYESYAVAPTLFGGPVASTDAADTHWFGDPTSTATAYARACLWALTQATRDIAAEEEG